MKKRLVTREKLEEAIIEIRKRKLAVEKEKLLKKILKENLKQKVSYNTKKNREVMLRSRYGLSLKGFDDLVAQQSNSCAVCGDSMEKPYVDHNHRSGRIRGLLCYRCNTGLGFMRENTRILLAAVEYLTLHKSDARQDEIELAEKLLKRL